MNFVKIEWPNKILEENWLTDLTDDFDSLGL